MQIQYEINKDKFKVIIYSDILNFVIILCFVGNIENDTKNDKTYLQYFGF